MTDEPWAFAAAVFVLNATPGADLLLTLTRTLQRGSVAGLGAAAGICVGAAVHAVAAAMGLAALLAVSPLAFAALKWFGAAYLLWLGVGLLRQAWQAPGASAIPAAALPTGVAADFRVGLWTNLTNPKVVLFFAAFLPGFVAPHSRSEPLAFLLLGLWFVAQSAVFLAAVVLAAGRLRGLGASPAAGRWTRTAAGVLFVGLAWRLANTRAAGA